MPRLALNTENSPLIDAGEQAFFTSLWIRLFCRLSFFARNVNSGLFIRRTVCRSVHLCVFCLWRVCSYISKQKLTRLRGARCSLAASVPDLYLFQWPKNFAAAWKQTPFQTSIFTFHLTTPTCHPCDLLVNEPSLPLAISFLAYSVWAVLIQLCQIGKVKQLIFCF